MEDRWSSLDPKVDLPHGFVDLRAALNMPIAKCFSHDLDWRSVVAGLHGGVEPSDFLAGQHDTPVTRLGQSVAPLLPLHFIVGR